MDLNALQRSNIEDLFRKNINSNNSAKNINKKNRLTATFKLIIFSYLYFVQSIHPKRH